ncbi:4a-hydroxytetrahydrobiopterin dehydratase [Roseimicrobium gellanilyticum]|uniref:Putative pterin-4-alpha-carbinolamine dehydratase n=1 Tax=Roseimicrobium gellanilyticum TaxID=748857 RepID=A0A366HTI4_9BACT|nr:4a-hydroxytetrahydrobiopterin dehydratase [Roseimicrobium gellanilyticum]RBP47582.1 4a-hydroxytetrahydrobiopterin dehydratase [Roseimicrobium gellanilyticum]
MAELLQESEIVEQLSAVAGWSREGVEIVRLFKFSSYMAGIDFVVKVAHLAEEANHHPDMQVGWRKVTVRLSTHSKGGLTKLDFALARQVDGLVG